MYTKWLVFKSVRGLDKPWLVFSPAARKVCPEFTWSQGHATWKEAIAYIAKQVQA